MNSGMKNLGDFIAQHNNFIISTHESPDGDGLGAEIAFNHLLKNLGKNSVILNSDPVPDKFKFIDIDKEITVYSENTSLPENIDDYAIFVLDTNNFDNIGALHQILKECIKDVLIIDHHEGDKNTFESGYIKVEASSACEIVYSIIKHYNVELNFKTAQALYAGILFDTGSFRYPKTSPETFRITAELVELGANPFSIYEQIYENNLLETFELRAMMLASMEIHYNGKLILMKLTPEMLKKTGANYADGELNINMPHTIKGVIASVLVKQNIDGPIKVSMRTKGDYDVAAIAVANGGGGHKNASGYKSKLSFEETCKKAVKDLEHFFIKN
jgi:phosphoesterase RecJ-like protein